MKQQLLIVALLAICVSASAQGVQKTLPINKSSQLDYEVANDGHTKDGLYYVKNLAKDKDALYVQGHYKNNARTGTWYFFDAKGNLTMRYSYDQGKILFMEPKSLHNVSVNVLSDDPVVAKNATAPLPLCPVDYYASLIGNEIYAHYYDPTNDNLTAEIIAHIDAAGKATYTIDYIFKDRKSLRQSIDFKPVFPIEWLPATYEKKAIPSEFTIYAKISPKTDDQEGHARFDWNNDEK